MNTYFVYIFVNKVGSHKNYYSKTVKKCQYAVESIFTIFKKQERPFSSQPELSHFRKLNPVAFGTFQHTTIKLNVPTAYFKIVQRIYHKLVMFYLQNMNSETFT